MRGRHLTVVNTFRGGADNIKPPRRESMPKPDFREQLMYNDWTGLCDEEHVVYLRGQIVA